MTVAVYLLCLPDTDVAKLEALSSQLFVQNAVLRKRIKHSTEICFRWT